MVRELGLVDPVVEEDEVEVVVVDDLVVEEQV